MTKLLALLGATIGGWIGWFIGAWVGMFTAFVLSMVGTGIGMYASRQITKRWL